LYKGLVNVAIIQGAYQSPVSIINIIPIEDYSAIVKPIIDSLVSDQDVKAYGEQFLFQKNNFADDTIVPQVIVNFEEMPGVEPIEFGEDLVYFYMSDNFPSQLGLGPNKILLLDPRYNRDELEYDIVKMKRLIEQDGDTIDVFTGTSVVSKMYAIRKAQGDVSLRDVIGYQKVRYANGDPVLDFDEKGVGRHVYKMVNLLGDGNRASEYYLDARPSVFNNGTVKVENEISDKVVRDYYEALNLEFRETDEYTPFEELFVEQPQLSEAQQPLPETMITGSGMITLKDGDISFEMGDTFKRSFYSVEQAFQYLKSIVAGDPFKGSLEVTEKIANETNNAKLKALGSEGSLKTFPEGLKEWNRMSETFMDELLLVASKQNSANIGEQLSLFDENKPEGLPAIDRTNETCD
jgi:hypothetical protein